MLAPILMFAFLVFSPDLAPGARLTEQRVWNRDGCHGANRSPALRWKDAPPGTRSFALSMFDPDAGTAGWWHWVAYDIPASQHELPEGVATTVAPLEQGINDFGVPGFGGPCPPPGPAHHYVFTVYALDVARLGAQARLRGPAFRSAIAGHVLASATLTGRYSR